MSSPNLHEFIKLTSPHPEKFDEETWNWLAATGSQYAEMQPRSILAEVVKQIISKPIKVLEEGQHSSVICKTARPLMSESS